MLRSRVLLLTALAALFVAGPVVAYWPVLFGVSAVFGQECPRAQETRRTMPYADAAPVRYREVESCEVFCQAPPVDRLTAWRRLWKEGRHAEALGAAQRAVDADPDNMDAQHALAVSKIVANCKTTTPRTNVIVGDEYSGPARVGATRRVYPATLTYPTQAWSGILPAGTLTPDLTPVTSCPLDFDVESNCPLASFLSSIFGCGKQSARTGCGVCPITEACCECPIERMIQRKLEMPHSFHWTDARLSHVVHDLKMLTGINVVVDSKALRAAGISLEMPMTLDVENVKLKSALNLLLGDSKLGYVIKDKTLQITTAQNADACCVQATSTPDCCKEQTVRGNQSTNIIFIVREPMPTMVPSLPPAMVFSQPLPQAMTFSQPLPPPHFAPPPPFILSADGMPVIPVPVTEPMAPTTTYQFVPPPQRMQSVLYDPAESCDSVCPAMPCMPAGVRITQQGRRVQLASPNYDAICDRIRGGTSGQLMLEGNVQLVSRRHGQTMSINAQRVMLNVKDDQFVVERAEGMDSSRVNIAPVGCQAPEVNMEEALKASEYRSFRGEVHYTAPPSIVTPIRTTSPIVP